MRSDIATIAAFGLSICSLANAQSVPPTFSCFDPPEEGQTNPLGEGMEDVVGSMCCEALIVEGDIEAGRQVVWDPVNCNYGPGEEPIAEAFQCRAHDTDGCRFCYDSCVGFAEDEICITCEEVFEGAVTSSPTGSPTDFTTEAPFGIFPETPSPVVPTDAPVAPTPSPVVPTDAPVVPETPAPTTAAPSEIAAGGSECECINSLSPEEAAVLARRNKAMVCDETCTNGLDEVWGVMNCNYFALGQDCRACSNICTEMSDGTWEDPDGFPCKPCSAI